MYFESMWPLSWTELRKHNVLKSATLVAGYDSSLIPGIACLLRTLHWLMVWKVTGK